MAKHPTNSTSTSPNEPSPPPTTCQFAPELASQSGVWKRWLVRLFFVAFVVVLIVDTCPTVGARVASTKLQFSAVLSRLGLWQGQWTLFAPNPKINNAWLAAEVYRPDGTQHEFWNSTYWAETSTWERFSGFRHINYNNRIQTQGRQAADDLADYLARRLIGPTAVPIDDTSGTANDTGSVTKSDESKTQDANSVQAAATADNNSKTNYWRLVLTRNELNLSLPDDGSLPARDDTLWISSSQNLTVREYLP